MNFNKRAQLVSSIEIGRILRATRRYTGHTQVQMAKELGVEQSAYSRIESGDQGLTTPQWFRFCEVTNIVPEAVRTGFIEFYDDPAECPKKKDNMVAHRFKVPARYQLEAGTTTRELMPFLSYAERSWGERKADTFIETMGVSREFFMILNNRINLDFCLDLSRELIERGELNKKGVEQIASVATEPQIHGILRYRYEGAKTSIDVLSSLIESSRRYECNFKHEILSRNSDKMTVSIAPEPHLERFAYRDDPVLGDFLCTYKKAYFKKFATFGGRKGVSVEEKECHYHGPRSHKCVYEIRQLV